MLSYSPSQDDQLSNQGVINFSYGIVNDAYNKSRHLPVTVFLVFFYKTKLKETYIVNTNFLLLLAGDIETHPGPENSEDLLTCPCDETAFCKLIKCVKCSQQYHIICVGLDGITNAALDKLRNWYCPLCLTLPDKIKKKMVKKFESSSETTTDLDKILKNIKEVEENIIKKIDSKNEENHTVSPYLATTMKNSKNK